MKLQSTPLDTDSEYVLDCCCDDEDIDQSASMALRLYGDRARIKDIVENTPVVVRQEVSPSGWRRNIAGRLCAYADELIEHLTIPQQGMLYGLGLVHLRHVVTRGAEHLAFWALGDMVEGGYAQNYNRPARSKDGVTPYAKDARRARAPNFIRRYVKREACPHWRPLANSVIRRGVHLPRSAIVADVEIATKLLDEQRQRINAHHAQQWDEVEHRRNQGQPLDIAVTLKPGVRKRWRSRARDKQRVMKRAAKTAVSVLGEQAVANFAKGKEVMIVGEQAAYRVKPRRGLSDLGHGALDLTLCDPVSLQSLASLCFYIEKTPTLDQLTAIGLHAAAGEELDILKTANVTAVMRDGIGHPLLASRMPEPARAIDEMIAHIGRAPAAEIVTDRRSIRERRGMRDAQYFADTQDIWIDAVGVYMLGPRLNKLSIELTRI